MQQEQATISRPGRLAGRKILITGAGSGIGAAAARTFREEGASLALLDISEDRVAVVARDLGVMGLRCDVGNEKSVAGAVEAAAKALGGIDGIVNCAGLLTMCKLEEIDLATWHRDLAVNLTGPLLLAQHALPWLRAATHATVVNVASGQALLPMPGSFIYATTKGGLIALTRSLAVELGPRIRVNAICPGAVDTPLLRKPEQGGPTGENYVLKRVAQAQEIANALLFLTSRESSYMTGATVAVDGGRTFH